MLNILQTVRLLQERSNGDLTLRVETPGERDFFIVMDYEHKREVMSEGMIMAYVCTALSHCLLIIKNLKLLLMALPHHLSSVCVTAAFERIKPAGNS